MSKKIVWLLLISFTIPSFSLAAGIVTCGTRENPAMCTTCDFLALIQNILTLIFKYSFVLGAIFIMIAGFNMMFSQGNEGKIKLAWKTITNVIIGIVIILAAWLIVNTILYYFAPGSPDLQKNCYHLKCNPATNPGDGGSITPGGGDGGGGSGGGFN